MFGAIISSFNVNKQKQMNNHIQNIIYSAPERSTSTLWVNLEADIQDTVFKTKSLVFDSSQKETANLMHLKTDCKDSVKTDTAEFKTISFLFFLSLNILIFKINMDFNILFKILQLV